MQQCRDQPFVGEAAWVQPQLGGVESLGISKLGQTVLARLQKSHIWHQPEGGRAQKRNNGLCSPSARHFSPSLCTTGAFQAATPVLGLRGSESEWMIPCMDF